MSNKPIDMFHIRQILRLYAQGRGSKYISTMTGVARNTVKKYLLAFARSGLTYQEAEKLNDSRLAAIVYNEKSSKLTNNERRPHEGLNNLTPVEYKKLVGEKKKAQLKAV